VSTDYRELHVVWFFHGSWHILKNRRLEIYGSYIDTSLCGGIDDIAISIGGYVHNDADPLSIFDMRIRGERLCVACRREFAKLIASENAQGREIMAELERRHPE
jgi:hypothetical protein